MTRTCGVSGAIPSSGPVTNSSWRTGTAGTWHPAAAASPADQAPAAITTIGAATAPAVVSTPVTAPSDRSRPVTVVPSTTSTPSRRAAAR